MAKIQTYGPGRSGPPDSYAGGFNKEEALTAAGTALELLGNANNQNFTPEP